MNGLPRVLILLALSVNAAAASEPAPAEVAPEVETFFETRIRPLLAERCWDCHGAETQESDLRLDSRAGLLAGGASGEVLSADEPAASRLLAAVRHEGDLAMPPDDKLTDQEIAALETWIGLGAPWPAAPGETPEPVLSPEERIDQVRARHWAFQPLRAPEIPAVDHTNWPTSDVDRLILARLEAEGLTPSPAADRHTLIRRAAFDLTGLPPTAEEVEAFVNDSSPDAFAQVVDRLLASPRYSERWGRHWLDVARYADTKGYVFTAERRYPFAYTYRDYVIRAFNEDLPYDRFLLEQLAADQLELGDDKRPLAAMGFLTVGRRFSNNTHDIIDDRIDVVTRGLLGLTVACARCHDHKYDPIPTEDYYALYGVFSSSIEPDDLPQIGESDDQEAFRAYEEGLAERRAEIEKFLDELHAKLEQSFQRHAGDYLVEAVRESDAPELPDGVFISLRPDEIRPRVARRWREYLTSGERDDDPVFRPWRALAALGKDAFAAESPHVLATFAGDDAPVVNPRVREALESAPPQSMADVARTYGALFSQIDDAWRQRSAAAPELTALEDPADEQLRQVLHGPESPTRVARDDLLEVADRAEREKLKNLQNKVDAWKVTSPGAPPRAMTMVDAARPADAHVFVRGNPRRQGELAPRQFPRVLTGPERTPFSQGSGRLELARAIVDPNNPLTRRVWVNRVWMHHFGAPLVDDPSDFGTRSEPPTHPELLDHLAWWFQEQGQSTKKLHRMLMLSAVYQQASVDRPECRARDAENRMLWRMNRRRLEFEEFRDALLAAAGRLDERVGGRSVDLTSQPFTTRRTVYGMVDRQVLPDVFRTFDFASPDATTARRPRTTVPQQALFAMNSPFAMEQAGFLAQRAAGGDGSAEENTTEQISALHRAVFSRPATEDEIELGLEFLASADGSSESGENDAWRRYAQVLLMTNEFTFVD